jgi:hypothetical protein
MSQEKYDQRTEKSDDNAYAKGVAIGALFSDRRHWHRRQ